MSKAEKMVGFARRHPYPVAVGIVAASAFAFANCGGSSKGAAEHGGNTSVAVENDRGVDLANKNPDSRRLGCTFVLKAAGAHYDLSVAITEGRPPRGSKVDYHPKYQGNFSQHFNSHRTDPADVLLQAYPAAVAEIPAADQGLPLASVSGHVGTAACTPAFVHHK